MKFPTQTLLQSLFDNAQNHPDKLAFISGDAKTTYANYIKRIAAAKQRLLDCGIKKNDRVLLMGSNHDDFAVAYFAIHFAGAICVPVDGSLKATELDFIVNDTKPHLAIVEINQQLSIQQKNLKSFTLPGEATIPLEILSNLKDDADILYTTGTTARKKGVLLTHGNIAAAALNISSFINNKQSDLEVLPIPLSHSFGLGRLRSMALVGNTLVLEPGLKNPAVLLKRVLDLKANGLALVPAGFELMLRLTRGKLVEAQDHLKYIEIGSAPMRDETRLQLMTLLPNTRLCHHYGLTEASRACFKEFHTDSHKPMSIGKPSPNVQISFINIHGKKVAPEEGGELIVHGAMTMKKYWNRLELNSQAYINGGLRTGDIGRMDKEGYIYLRGRKDDIINIGGLKVAPTEVESAALLNGAIKECACVGLADEITGEKTKLFYVSDRLLDDRELINQLRSHLEEYKVPKVFERVKLIPKTDSGKIIRQALLTKQSENINHN